MAQIRDQALLQKIALKLKELREERGISQDELYDALKIHIARIETAKINLSVSTLSRLCDYFNVSLSDFFKDV